MSPLWLAGAQVVELSSTALPGVLVGNWTASVTIQTQSNAHTGCHYCRLGEIHHNTTDTIRLYFMVEWGRGSRQSLLPFHQCLLCFSLFFIMRDTFLDLCKELMKNRKQAETFPTVVDPSGLIFWLSVLGLSQHSNLLWFLSECIPLCLIQVNQSWQVSLSVVSIVHLRLWFPCSVTPTLSMSNRDRKLCISSFSL